VLESPEQLAEEIAARIRAMPALNTDELRALRREVSKRISREPPQFVIRAAFKLLERRSIESRFLACELVRHHSAALAILDKRQLERFGRGMDSWSAVDIFSCYLAGQAWRRNQIEDSVIHGWARSRDRWWRRAALVSTVPLNSKAQGGSGDPVRTLEVCDLLINDRDDMVVKAMSWALRELAKREPREVQRFLNERKNALAPRVIREVENKLSTGLKNPRPARTKVRTKVRTTIRTTAR